MLDDKKSLVRDLFEGHQRKLLGYLTRKVGRDAAPDLLQDAFVRVLGQGELSAVANPPALLQQIAVNLVRDFARKRKTETTYRRSVPIPADAPAEHSAPEERIEYERKSRLLDAAVDTLPPRCREVFELTMADVPVGEIAQRLGISDRMVRKHLALAMQLCRAAID